MRPNYYSIVRKSRQSIPKIFLESIFFFYLTIILLLGFNTLQAQHVGGVYAMTNGSGQVDGNVQGPNTVVAYGQAADGTLTLLGTYPTGGNGGDFDGGEGLDPLISAYAITKTLDNRFVLAVNAGSSSVTAMKVNADFSLTVTDTEGTQDLGPNSIAFKPSSMPGVSGLVYVSNITRAEFLAGGEPEHQGSVIGYRLMDNGDLIPVANSIRDLANRPSAVQFSPDGNYLVVASINSGASALASGSEDEIVLYRVNADGTLSANQTDGATSTLRGNAEGRNLPSAIGFQIVGDNYVVVTEAREFQPNGAPPAFPALQDGSVSTWQIMPNGTFRPVDLDVASGENNTGRTACWLDFSDEHTFFVSNAIEAGLASYSFNDGAIELLDQVAAQGVGATGNTTDPAAAFGTTEGWIDMWISDDGKYLYQLFGLTGEIGVYAIDGANLTFVEKISGDLPVTNTQGIVSVGQPGGVQEVTAEYRIIFDATWSAVTHPTDFPADEPNIARWSPVAGMTHNASTQLFEAGTIASQGIVNISQSGSRQPLDAEIAAMINAGYAETYIESATRVRPSPDTISTTFTASTSHPYLSLASMIAPSPDWFVGFNNLNLVENGEFVESKVIQFTPYDSGSDSGASFASDNQDTQPREGIFKITDGVLEGENGYVPSLGIWRIERIDANSNCNTHGGYLAGGPYTFTVDGVADHIPAGALTLTGTNGAGNQWVVTDDRGYILGLPGDFTGPNFDEAGVGVCFIRNLAYDPGLTGLEVGNNIADLSGCFSFSNGIYVNRVAGNGPAVGGVYAMTNGEGQVAGNVQGPNAVVAYGQAADGTLTLLGTYPTGGNGGDFDGGEGLDPLISAYAITKTLDNRFVLAVNAGSSSVTAMKVNADFSLTVTDTEGTQDLGPNSIAFKPSSMPGVSGLVYVSNITRAEFLAGGEPEHQGSVIGYRLMDNGDLIPVANSIRDLANRPSAVQFSPDGNYLVVASINSGASALASGSEDEIVLYRVNADGTLSANQTDGATSTLRGNAEGRNLPSAIGFQIVGDNYVVVTEAREFQPNGAPPAFPALQDGSVSTWQIMPNGTFRPVDLDVASGENNTGRTACWLDFSDEHTFFVSNAIEAGLASYSFNDGAIELLDQVAAQGVGATGNTTDPAAAFGTTEGWIDMWISDDGKYLYQLFGLTGEIGVYGIDGTSLTFIEKISGDLPVNNTQGIVSVGQPGGVQEVTAEYRIIFDATWSAVTHPTDFPADEPNIARWSPVAGMTHNASTQLFEAGTIASQGIVNISQSGSRQPLDAEIAAMINAGYAETYIESATRVRPSPDTISTTFTASTSHPYLSLASMIAPSPDWFVGFNNLNLVENGEFVESKVVQFTPYDSGSDSGASFASDNQDTQPREGIFKITDGVLEGENGYVPSLGIWRIERIDANSNCNTHGGYLAGGPYTFTVDGVADHIPAGALTLTGTNGAGNQWVVTDDRGYILGLPGDFTGPNFDEAGVGVCFIRNLAYDPGLTGLEVGNNIADLSGCFSFSNGIYVNRVAGNAPAGPAVGGVFAMTNGNGQVDGNVQGPNAVVAYGQAADGTLSLIGTYPTGGNGGDFDGGEGLDPLISAYAITKTLDNRFVLAVNAGSSSVTAMKVNADFSLTVTDTEGTQDLGPNSIAFKPSSMPGVSGLVYVSNITRAEFLAGGEPEHQGSVIGYRLMDNGDLIPVANSIRDLANRPSAVQFSPDGNYLVVASINSGASALASGSEDEIVLYRVNADGTLSANQTDGATSTLRGNAEGRNLPSAIGFQIVGDNYVVVTEAREFQPNGAPPAFPALQDGSVSTWQIMPNGTFRPVDLDVASGENNTGRTACWLDFSDEHTFFVSNAIEAGLASYSFNDGAIELLDQVAAQGVGATGNTTDPAAAFGTTEGWIDMWISDDGKYLYQLFGLTGEIGVYGIDGTSLTFIEKISGDLPTNNTQGIVSVGQPAMPTPPAPAVGGVFAMTNGNGQVDGNVQGPNSVVAYGQAADGTLSLIGTYPTGGNGGDFDGGEGLDPLISAYAITKTLDNRFVLAVNAGSSSVTAMKVNADFSLTVTDTEGTQDLGPNSIAFKPSSMPGVSGLVYVSNITRAEFLAGGEPEHQGSVIGYRLMDNGDLIPIANSIRDLANRPSAVQFSPDGNYLVVASINSGASALASGSEDEIVLYRVNADGTLSANQTDGATSTLRGNAEGRNLPSAIGFQIVGDNYVVVTEAREFQPNGAPPAFPALQDGSVSTWQIMPNGTFRPVDLDVASGENNTGRTACWLDFSDEHTFFVSNAIEAGLASYSFNDGAIELLDQVAAQGVGATGNTTDPASAFGTTEGWIDMWISDDGKYLYQLFGLTGEIGVYGIDGTSLTFIEKISGDLPVNNTQGIVSVGQPQDTPPVAEETARYRVTFDAAWMKLTHPTDFPADPRFSPVAGMTHNTSTQLFEEGTIASQGIVNISQSGSRQPLDAEIAAMIDAGYAETYIESATRVRPSPDTISTTFEVSTSHPYLSLTSMIAPSPDWIVGFNNLNLVEDGKFIESRIVQFVPYDTGSDSGESFESPNQDTQPRETIYEITDGPLSSNGQINSIGIWRIERIDGGSTCDVAGGSIVGGPFEYCVDGEADNIPAGAIALANNTGANSQWVITDERGYILGLPASFTGPNFDAAGVGVCFVWHLSYEDGLQGLAMGNNIESLDGCFDLSNSIYVNRKECVAACDVDGGNIVGGPFEFCVSDGEADHIPAGAILTEGKKGSNSQYVVTDLDGNILGLPPTPQAVNFDVAGPGVCLVWHLSYEDGLTGLAAGNNISELEGCYDLSNQIRVIRNDSGEICEADATCNAPADIQIDVVDSRRVRIDWENVDNAAKYFIQIRFQGQPRIIAGALVRHSRVHLFGPSGRDYELRLQTVCKDGSQSEFTEWIPFSTPARNGLVAAQGRSADNFIADITIGDEATPMTTFPNPVSDVLNVYYETTTETAVLTVFHISGKKVAELALGKDATSHQVNVADLTNGIYLIRIDEAGQVPVTKRVVKGSNR